MDLRAAGENRDLEPGRHTAATRDGKELFYRDPYGAVIAVRTMPEFGQGVKVLEPRDYSGRGLLLQGRQYEITREGRFLMAKMQAQELVLVANWLERLKEALPVP